VSRRRPARFALSKLDKAGCSALGAGQRADAVKKEMPSLGGSVPMHSVDVFSCKHARTYGATANACSNFASICAFTECITAGLTAVTQSALATAHAARSCLLQTNHAHARDQSKIACSNDFIKLLEMTKFIHKRL
jgi:hypothetical protein